MSATNDTNGNCLALRRAIDSMLQPGSGLDVFNTDSFDKHPEGAKYGLDISATVYYAKAPSIIEGIWLLFAEAHAEHESTDEQYARHKEGLYLCCGEPTSIEDDDENEEDAEPEASGDEDVDGTVVVQGDYLLILEADMDMQGNLLRFTVSHAEFNLREDLGRQLAAMCLKAMALFSEDAQTMMSGSAE